MITLRIKKAEFEAIKNGTKKSDWRKPSLFNKRILLDKNQDGLFCENKKIKEIKFVNGYLPTDPFIICKIILIRPVKFTRNIEIKDDNFIAIEGECSIEIQLGKIIQ